MDKKDLETIEDVSKEEEGTRQTLRSYTPEEERAVVRKLDWNLMPIIFVLYSLSVLDRSNLGNAKIAGMADDIDLSGNRYNWLATIFYIAYILFQFSTAGWKLFPPHRWISGVVFAWGLVSTLQSVTTSWAGLMVCRFFLGLAETSFGPGAPLYFSFFYPREYVGFRIGIFIAGSALANAYGGTLAYALSHIHSHVSNWRFLFIVEGIPTVLLSVVAWFVCPDSPGTAWFLTERERIVAKALAERQPGDYQNSGLQFRQMFAAFKDYRCYFTAMINFGCNVSFGSLPLFLPTIIADMGSFTPLQSNGLTAPPYLLCFLLILATGVLSDRVRARGPFVVAAGLVSGVGFIILATTTATAPRYFGIFLAVNIFVAVAVNFAWVVNNAGTDSKRAGGLWILQLIGQCGPLLGTNMFPADGAPYYRKGMWVCCAFCLLVAALAGVQSVLLHRENVRRDRHYGELQNGKIKVDVADRLEGDENFRYFI